MGSTFTLHTRCCVGRRASRDEDDGDEDGDGGGAPPSEEVVAGAPGKWTALGDLRPCALRGAASCRSADSQQTINVPPRVPGESSLGRRP
jgi:hypothetical protein